MDYIETIGEPSHFKLLGDARRVQILRYLMAEPATLTQLGEKLGAHPAKVRYHLKQLEEAGLVVLSDTQIVRGFVEKYYRASARAYQVRAAILPQSERQSQLIIAGSHDLALELLAKSLKRVTTLYTLPIGSMDGLIALRQGIGHAAGIHLLDADSGEYNLPFAKHLFPDKVFHLLTLAHRQQGLIVAAGNPLGLRDISALAEGDIRFVNRRTGSGTRLWLDRHLAAENIPTEQIDGYDWSVDTHVQVAEAVAQNKADVGLGLEAAARAFGLGFVPLFEERYDLVVLDEQLSNPQIAPAFDFLQTASFRNAVTELGGYSTRQMGVEITV